MKNRLLKTVGIFLLLVPFRLTISIVLIKIFTFTSTVSGESVPLKVISASVMTSKLCYDLALGIWLSIILYNIYKDLADNKDWLAPAILFSVLAILIFIVTDLYLTNELFWHFNK